MEARRSREGPLAASEREGEEESVEVFGRQSGGFPVEVGLEGKKEPGAPGASGIPQQEAGGPRSGQKRQHGGERMRKNTSSRRSFTVTLNEIDRHGDSFHLDFLN